MSTVLEKGNLIAKMRFFISTILSIRTNVPKDWQNISNMEQRI